MRTLATSAFCIGLVCTLLTGSSFAGGNSSPIEKVSPAGSCTYFVTLTVWSPSGVDLSAPIPATLQSTRQVQRLIRQLERQTGTPPVAEAEASDNPDPAALPDPDEPLEPRPLSVQVWQFTTTVWSDGSIEQSPFTPVTHRSLHQILVRLEAAEEEYNQLRNQPKPQAQPGREPATYPTGERCHARTDAGHRCSRKAKGTTGMCWQHQQHQDAYPLP